MSGKDKILIVDDSITNIEMLKMILSDTYDVYTTKESKKAFEISKTENIDLILLDIEMPGLNGYEVCKILKSEPETTNIPVIFVTSRSDAAAEEKGLNAGAIDYITKPFGPAKIKARIHNHLKLKHYQDQLEELSMRDGLTGLYNKRKFEDYLQLEWARAKREKKSISLLMIDIDFFKGYNDHYGHIEGDACLKAVAQSIESSIQNPRALASRFGGEEFICLLPDLNKSQAVEVAKTVLSNVRKLNIPHQASKASDKVTISIGCVTSDSIDENLLATDFIVKGDKLLYKAKQSGRNQICAGSFQK